MPLDRIDKLLIHHLSIGTHSYEELARLCNVSRNTIYRRITTLQNRGIIAETLRFKVNFDQLDIAPIIFGATIPAAQLDKTISLLTTHRNIRFLWRTFGEHNIVFVALSLKGEEGELIQSLNSLLENMNATKVKVSTGFTWEKMDSSPYEEEIETEQKKLKTILANLT